MTLFHIAWLGACAAVTYWNLTNGIKEWTSGLAGFNWRWQVSKIEKPAVFYLLICRRILGVVVRIIFFTIGLRFADWV